MTRKKPNKKQDKNAIRETCEKKQHSTVRKPGLPPARSPEITQSRPHGHKFSQVRGNPIRPAMTQSRSRRKGKTDNEIGPRVRLDSRVTNSQSPLRVHSVDLFLASSSSLEGHSQCYCNGCYGLERLVLNKAPHEKCQSLCLCVVIAGLLFGFR